MTYYYYEYYEYYHAVMKFLGGCLLAPVKRAQLQYDILVTRYGWGPSMQLYWIYQPVLMSSMQKLKSIH